VVGECKGVAGGERTSGGERRGGDGRGEQGWWQVTRSGVWFAARARQDRAVGGIVQKYHGSGGVSQAFICKMTSPPLLAIRSRSNAHDLSLHSLHEWVGSHMIRSQKVR
jgi:hypothetical protein